MLRWSGLVKIIEDDKEIKEVENAYVERKEKTEKRKSVQTTI